MAKMAELPPLKVYPFMLNELAFFAFFFSRELACTDSWLTTIKILRYEAARSKQIVQTQIRLLLKEQSDHNLHCFPCHLHHWTHHWIKKQTFHLQGSLHLLF